MKFAIKKYCIVLRVCSLISVCYSCSPFHDVGLKELCCAADQTLSAMRNMNDLGTEHLDQMDWAVVSFTVWRKKTRQPGVKFSKSEQDETIPTYIPDHWISSLPWSAEGVDKGVTCRPSWPPEGERRGGWETCKVSRTLESFLVLPFVNISKLNQNCKKVTLLILSTI